MKKNIVLGISGASGAIYAVRFLEVAVAAGFDVHLTITPSAQLVLKQELELSVDLDNFKASSLLLSDGVDTTDSKLNMMRQSAGISSGDSNVLSFNVGEPGVIHYHHHADMMAPIASGSFLTAGMVICPCSTGTLASVVNSLSSNLLQRAAQVHLKERRKLIAVPRETPLSTPQVEAMLRASQAGIVILPASPAFYHGVKTIQDLVDFVVARICDQVGIEHGLIRRWGT